MKTKYGVMLLAGLAVLSLLLVIAFGYSNNSKNSEIALLKQAISEKGLIIKVLTDQLQAKTAELTNIKKDLGISIEQLTKVKMDLETLKKPAAPAPAAISKKK